MTPEQNKTLGRCKDMLKQAFPEMDGKFIFRLNSHLLGSKGIAVDMFMPNLRLLMASDKPVTEVDLTFEEKVAL